MNSIQFRWPSKYHALHILDKEKISHLDKVRCPLLALPSLFLTILTHLHAVQRFFLSWGVVWREGRKKTHHFYPLLKVHYINNIFFALFSIRPFTYCIYYKSRQRCKVRLKQQCSIKKRTFKKKKMKQGNGNVNTTCHPKINYWGSFLQTSLLLSWVKGKKWLLY